MTNEPERSARLRAFCASNASPRTRMLRAHAVTRPDLRCADKAEFCQFFPLVVASTLGGRATPIDSLPVRSSSLSQLHIGNRRAGPRLTHFASQMRRTGANISDCPFVGVVLNYLLVQHHQTELVQE